MEKDLETNDIYAQVDEYLNGLTNTRRQEMFDTIKSQRDAIREHILANLEAEVDPYVTKIQNQSDAIKSTIQTYQNVKQNTHVTVGLLEHNAKAQREAVNDLCHRFQNSHDKMLTAVEQLNTIAVNHKTAQDLTDKLETHKSDLLNIQQEIKEAQSFIRISRENGLPVSEANELKQQKLAHRYRVTVKLINEIEAKLRKPDVEDVLLRLLIQFKETHKLVQGMVDSTQRVTDRLVHERDSAIEKEERLRDELFSLAKTGIKKSG